MKNDSDGKFHKKNRSNVAIDNGINWYDAPNGGVPPSTPNSMLAVFSDKRSGQRGTVTIDLNPEDSIIVFKLKKVPRGVIIKDKSFYDARPFTIPAEITLKRKKD